MPKNNVKKRLETKSGKTAEMEQKAITFELKAADDETNIIVGYASSFGGEPDHDGDVVAPGAYAKTIVERATSVKVLYGHDWSQVIGKVIEMKEDNYGLWFKAKISDTARGNEIMTLVKDGVLDRISIGYRTIKSSWDSVNHIRTLLEVELYEISVVPFPANDRAIITGAKGDLSNGGTQEEKAGRVLSKKTETALREADAALRNAEAALATAVKEIGDVLALVEDPESAADDPKGQTDDELTDEQKQAAELEAKRLAEEAKAAEERKARLLAAIESTSKALQVNADTE